MLNSIEQYLEENGYKPIECLEDLGKEFKWWKKFRENVAENTDFPTKIWVKLYLKEYDEFQEHYLSMFIIDMESEEIVDSLIKPNGVYPIRDNDDMETLKLIFEDFEKIKNDLMPSDVVC